MTPAAGPRSPRRRGRRSRRRPGGVGRAESPARPRPRPRSATRCGGGCVAALGGSSATTVAAAVDVEGYGAGPAPRRRPPAAAGLDAEELRRRSRRCSRSARRRALPHRGRRASPTPVGGPAARARCGWSAGGDPYLTRSRPARARPRASAPPGITYVAGDVLLDDSRYDAAAPRRRAGSRLHAGRVRARCRRSPSTATAGARDSAFLADPALPNAVLFRDYLRAEGVAVARHRPPRAAARRPRARSPCTTARRWPPCVRRALKDSDNFAAELCSRRSAGSSAVTAAPPAASPPCVACSARTACPVGAGTDGSGLSSLDRQTTVRPGRSCCRRPTAPAPVPRLPRGAADRLPRRHAEAALLRHRRRGPRLRQDRHADGRPGAGRLHDRRASGRHGAASPSSSPASRPAPRALAAIDRAVVVLAASTD